jgi:4-amino-4-deoxy-L-arabinose transferase-like glycosyltransferase
MAMTSNPLAQVRAELPLVTAAVAVVLAVVWVRAGPPLLLGADSACYARVAREAAERPLSACAEQTLGGQPFFEHPPLALTAESLWFRVFGASAASARSFGRCVATLLVFAVFLVALRLAGARSAAFSVLALPLLSGFLFESQIAMLELPLTLGLGIATLGVVLLDRRGIAGMLLFAAGFIGAALTKGPPALAAFGVLAWATWRMALPPRTALVATTLALLGLGAAALLYEAARNAQGLPPFIFTYFSSQVFPSIIDGKGLPNRAPLFFVGPIISWYLAGLLMLVPAAWVWSRRATDVGMRRQIELGFVVAAIILLGQMVPARKAPWYVHPAMIGFAWMMGATASALRKSRIEPWLAGTAIALSTLWTLGVGRNWPLLQPKLRDELVAVHRLPPPYFPPGVPHDVAQCSRLGAWAAENTFAFVWRARAVPCGSPAPYIFDGQKLTPVQPVSP